MSHGDPVTVTVYLGINPRVVERKAGTLQGTHVFEASPAKVWSNPPNDPGGLLVLPLEIELPEEAFLPTMPKVQVSIPIETVGGPDVKVKGGIKRLDVTKTHERKLG